MKHSPTIAILHWDWSHRNGTRTRRLDRARGKSWRRVQLSYPNDCLWEYRPDSYDDASLAQTTTPSRQHGRLLRVIKSSSAFRLWLVPAGRERAIRVHLQWRAGDCTGIRSSLGTLVCRV